MGAAWYGRRTAERVAEIGEDSEKAQHRDPDWEGNLCCAFCKEGGKVSPACGGSIGNEPEVMQDDFRTCAKDNRENSAMYGTFYQ